MRPDAARADGGHGRVLRLGPQTLAATRQNGTNVLATIGRYQEWARPSRWLRPATMLGLGIACYLAVAWPLNLLAGRLAGEPRAAIVSHKLDDLRAHAADYDVILIGSSRVHYDIDPAVLDRSLAEAGCPVRAYNFGIPGLTVAELHWLAARLAEIDGGWKAVLIERPQLPLRTWRFVGSGRHRMGHMELAQVGLSVEALATSSRSRLNAAVDMAQVALGYLYYEIGPGRLAELIEAKPETVPDEGFRIDLSRDGFVPLEEEVSALLKTRADRMDWDEYAGRLAGLRRTLPSPSPLPEARLEHLRAQIADAGKVAPNVGLLLLPQAQRTSVDDSASIAEAAAAGELGRVAVVNLGDPIAYPRLFDDGIWYDDDHLMGDGVPRASAALGPAICKALPTLRAAGG